VEINPLVEKLRNNFVKHFVPVTELNFDKSVVDNYGRHSCKQFTRGKPIRFGYKMWCLNIPVDFCCLSREKPSL
jgi:DNA excision repair protein ERCC-6